MEKCKINFSVEYTIISFIIIFGGLNCYPTEQCSISPAVSANSSSESWLGKRYCGNKSIQPFSNADKQFNYTIVIDLLELVEDGITFNGKVTIIAIAYNTNCNFIVLHSSDNLSINQVCVDQIEKQFNYSTDLQRLEIYSGQFLYPNNELNLFIRYSGKLNVEYLNVNETFNIWYIATERNINILQQLFPYFDEPNVQTHHSVILHDNRKKFSVMSEAVSQELEISNGAVKISNKTNILHQYINMLMAAHENALGVRHYQSYNETKYGLILTDEHKFESLNAITTQLVNYCAKPLTIEDETQKNITGSFNNLLIDIKRKTSTDRTVITILLSNDANITLNPLTVHFLTKASLLVSVVEMGGISEMEKLQIYYSLKYTLNIMENDGFIGVPGIENIEIKSRESEYLSNAYLNGKPLMIAKMMLQMMDANSIYDENDVTISYFVHSWTSTPGYPCIEFIQNDLDYKDVFNVRQFPFFYPTRTIRNNKISNHLFFIQIMYKIDMDDKRYYESLIEEQIVSNYYGKGNLTIVNYEEIVYYRVLYDQHNWMTIINRLLDKKKYQYIPNTNRAQLIDDSFNLARAGLLDYSIPLMLSQYLRHEFENLPWESTILALQFLDDALTNTDMHNKFRKYYKYLLEPLLTTNVEYLKQPTNQLAATVLRVACHLDGTKCLYRCLEYILNWMNDVEYNPIPVLFREFTYCTVQQYDYRIMLELLDLALLFGPRSEAKIILKSFGCINNENELVKRLLTAANNSHTNDFNIIIVSAAEKNPNITFKFIKENLNMIKNIHSLEIDGFKQIFQLLKIISKTMFEEIQYNEVNQFLIDNALRNHETAQLILNIIDSNILWKLEQYEKFARNFERHANRFIFKTQENIFKLYF